MVLFDIGVGKSSGEGKSPPESLSKIYKVHAERHITAVKNRVRTMLLTDGAACYPPFARKQSLLHEYVRHNRGEFVKDVKRGRSTIKCHTGTIDAAWTSCKKIIPNSLGAKHKDVMLYAKMWQWRFVNKYKKLLEKTVEMLRQMK